MGNSHIDFRAIAISSLIFHLGLPNLRHMRTAKSYQRRLATSIAVVFALQVFAVAFCATGQIQAAPIAETHAMAKTCPMDMDMPVKQQAPACAHCDLPDASSFTNSVSNLSVDLPLLAVIADILVNEINPADQKHRIAQAHAPPGSASIIYTTSLRIRL